jgi:hypothetical protein
MWEVKMVVVESTLRIIDYLIKLLNNKKQNKRQEFEGIVEPLFRDAEIVAKDYFQVLPELIHQIEGAKDISPIVIWLEKRRMVYLPVRMKIREYLRNFSLRSLDGFGSEIKSDSMGIQDKFISGIQEMLCGGLSLVEEGHIGTSHTLLDILIWDASKPFREVKSDLINRTKRQESTLHKAWQNIIDGYMERKAKVYGIKSKKKV